MADTVKYQDIIDRARKLCNDTSTAPNWKPTDYLAAIQAYLDRAGEVDPECLLQADGTLMDKPVASLNGLFGLGDHFWEDCLYWVCWMYYSSDSEATRDQVQANKYLGMLKMIGAPAAGAEQ